MADDLPETTRPESDEYLEWCERHPEAFDPDADVDDPRGEDCCPHCGKEFTEFADMGCGFCDRRSPEWGLTD